MTAAPTPWPLTPQAAQRCITNAPSFLHGRKTLSYNSTTGTHKSCQVKSLAGTRGKGKRVPHETLLAIPSPLAARSLAQYVPPPRASGALSAPPPPPMSAVREGQATHVNATAHTKLKLSFPSVHNWGGQLVAANRIHHITQHTAKRVIASPCTAYPSRTVRNDHQYNNNENPHILYPLLRASSLV